MTAEGFDGRLMQALAALQAARPELPATAAGAPRGLATLLGTAAMDLNPNGGTEPRSKP